ncbi:hypothetical protein GE300_02705 [Rhodobacteraceae bacterium 2CG4]|uniref:Lipoprotein n=1 Tax=Halovulum marinum TaxID=2662447 RepID=A0A6L5YWB3_9RHOB|nr:hypothetical protein [Halovulum marinum]MSU88528.1 hypothetical protein [Halovulum marinum]
MKTLQTAALCLLLTGCAAQVGGGMTQLEGAAGIPREYAGQLDAHELALILRLRNRSDLNRQERERRIDQVLRGQSPRLRVGF